MKKIVVLVVVCAAIAVGYFVWNHNQNDKAAAVAEDSTVKVERGPIKLSTECTGRVVSSLDVEIMCKASGEITTLPYDVSDPVEKGALLAELDPEDEERSVRKTKVQLASSQAKLVQARENLKTAEQKLGNDEKQAEANLRSAQAQHEDARAKAERMRRLLESKRVSQEEYETAQTAATLAAVELENAQIRLKEIEIEKEALEVKRQDVILAEAQVESDQIALEMDEQRLEDTKVYAPISGVVAQRNVQIGQIISSPMSNVGGGTTLMTLSDLSRVFVLASVDESDIGRVEVGQHVSITADAFPDSSFQGEVVRIATKGENVSNVVTFEVKIELHGKGKEKLKPEMTANVEIIAAENPDALLLPAKAVKRRGDQHFVRLRANGIEKEEMREIKVGINDGVRVEILEGLEEGETVLVSDKGLQSRWAKNKDNSPRPPGGPLMMMRMTRGRK